MIFEGFTGGFVQTNGYLIQGPTGHILIDAPAGIAAWLNQKGIRPSDVLLTHQHYDHVEDAATLQDDGAILHALEEYAPELTLESRARAWGLPIAVTRYHIDRRLEPDKGPLHVGGLEIHLAHVPGHSPDSVIFHFPQEGVVFSGDTLFEQSIGRTDLPGGSHEQLLEGIRRHLLTLPDSTRVFPGHGGGTTIGAEREGNPFL